MALTLVSGMEDVETISSPYGLDEFLSSPFVSREALSGDVACSLGELASDADVAKTDSGGCCGAVDVWRGAYERWCAQRGVAPATACAFARAVRERFGLRTVPFGRRADIGGHRVQYRVFVDGPYATGRPGGGRPRSRVPASVETAEFELVEPRQVVERVRECSESVPLTNLDVDSYVSRKSQLEAYISCGYLGGFGDDVVYDGTSGADSCDLSADDVPFVGALADKFAERALSYSLLPSMRVANVVSALKDGNLCTYELPEGEHVIELTCRMPFPDGCGGQVTNWCRLYLHLREKGALHYGEEANSEIRDSFDISLGFRFSDDCMLGMSISVFEEETFGLAEYSFELPTKDFEYFGKYVLTSGYALYILGDQADVSEAIHMLDVRGESVTSRELAKGEPDAPILYVPVVGEGEDGAVDYMLGRKPYQFGTWPYVRQVSSVGVLGAKACPVRLPDLFVK